MIILISKLLIRKSSLLVRGVVVHVQPVFPLFPRTEIALLNLCICMRDIKSGAIL